MTLNKAILEQIRGPINSSWNYLSADIADLYSEPGSGRLTKKGAMQMAIDAGRLSTYGGSTGKEADKIVADLIKAHGYAAVEKWLVRNINLLD